MREKHTSRLRPDALQTRTTHAQPASVTRGGGGGGGKWRGGGVRGMRVTGRSGAGVGQEWGVVEWGGGGMGGVYGEGE